MARALRITSLPRRPLHLPAAIPLLAAFAFAALSAAPAFAQSPPGNLHRVGDHWTAWDPPAPPPGAEVHVIVRGDTLWDLSRRFYGDPYLWPQLWEDNRYILDAHWIYPGDPLVVGLEVEEVDSLAELAVLPDEPPEPEETGDDGGSGILSAAAAGRPPAPLGTESDIYCTGYIDDPGRTFPFTIAGSEYESLSPTLDAFGTVGTTSGRRQGIYGNKTIKYGLMSGDLVYLDGGRQAGMGPGDLYTVVHPEERVRHPIDERSVGRFYRYLGRVQVLSVQESTAIAEIVHTCDPITVGSLLEPFVPEPVPLGRMTTMRPVNLPPSAESLERAPTILRAEDDIVTLAEDSIVYIDQGEADDVVPGDIYTIYRMNRDGLPPIVLGELAVLAVHGRSSVARILRSRYTIYVGDRLEPKN